MRWPMQASRVPTHRQRASHVIAALQFIATTFVMHAMVGRRSSQLKMPRRDAYTSPSEAQAEAERTALGALLGDKASAEGGRGARLRCEARPRARSSPGLERSAWPSALRAALGVALGAKASAEARISRLGNPSSTVGRAGERRP